MQQHQHKKDPSINNLQALKTGRAAAAASLPTKELGPQSCPVFEFPVRAAARHVLATCHVAQHDKILLHGSFPAHPCKHAYFEEASVRSMGF